MVWPDWLTARRVLAITLVQVAVLGLVGGVVFVNYGGFGGTGEPQRGYLELNNFGNESVNVTVVVVDIRTDTRLLEATLRLRTDGREGHYSFDWPTMPPGEKRATVLAGGHRDSYEFDAGEDGDGPYLSASISSDGIRLSAESGGM